MILKDICKINSGKSIKACLICDKDINHNIPCFGGNGLRGFVSSPNQVGGNPIIGRVGAQCGNIHYCDEPFYATEHALVVTLKDDNVNPQWLCRKFESMKLGTYAEGAAQPVIAASKLLQLEIAIPPLSEQQSIVDYLDSAFAKIDAMKANAEKALNEAKALFQASLKEMLEPDSPKYVTEGIPFVTQKNITISGFDLLNTKKISLEDHKKFYTRSNVEFGDIIIAMIGANRGMSCIVDTREIFSIKNVGLIKKNDNINMRYLLFYLHSPSANTYILNNSNGGAQEFIGLKGLRTFPIPYPPLSEQQSIVATLDSLKSKVDHLKANYDKISQECDALKQAILRQVFE